MMKSDPLSDEEIQALDDFLLNANGVHDAMDIATLDGFLTAIVSGPNVIPPSEWMRWVWDTENGSDSPEYESRAQAKQIIGLLIRHMNDIAQALTHSPEDYEPLLMENPNDGDPIPILDDWCWGFMKGVELDSHGWLPVTAGKPEWMSTIVLYGTEEGWAELDRKKLSVDEHKALAAELAGNVRKIHAFWLDLRRPGAGTNPARSGGSGPVSTTPKVGRNELCPCASGKKYKHCHGSRERLH